MYMNVEDDPRGWYDPATYRFQPNIAGRYRIIGRATVSIYAVGTSLLMSINKNGSIVASGRNGNSTSGSSYSATTVVETVISLNGSSDYVTINVSSPNASGSTLNCVNEESSMIFEYVGD
jgi:hypothetical protein